MGSGVAPELPRPLHAMGQKRWFCIPRIGHFEVHNATKYHVGSGVVPRPRIPLCTLGQKRCFCTPRMGLFELHNARKNQVGSGEAPQPTIPLHTMGQKRCFWTCRISVFELHNPRKSVFGSLEWVSLNCTMPQNIMWFLGLRPNHPYHCTAWARRGVFALHSTAHLGPEEVFLHP